MTALLFGGTWELNGQLEVRGEKLTSVYVAAESQINATRVYIEIERYYFLTPDYECIAFWEDVGLISGRVGIPAIPSHLR